MKKLVFLFLLFFNLSIVSASNKFKVTLDSCIDGDTARFVIKGEVRTVRFLSINAPEIAHDEVVAEPYGYEASDFTCNMLTNASTIKLQYDSKSDKEDKYGRVLAWVFVDDELLQEKLVSEGFAEVRYVYDDYMFSSKLKEFEKKAKDNKKGMWADSSHKYDYNYILLLTGVLVLYIMYHLFKKIVNK